MKKLGAKLMLEFGLKRLFVSNNSKFLLKNC